MAMMTQKAYAEKRRVTPQYVNKLVQQGKIRLVGKKVDSKQADAAIKAFRRAGRVMPAKKKPAKAAAKPSKRSQPRAAINASKMTLADVDPRSYSGSATANITAIRAMREFVDLQRAVALRDKDNGQLLPADQVLEAERKKNVTLRALLASLPRALAPALATTIEVAECEEILTRALDQVREEFASDPLGLKAAPAATVEVAAESAPAVEIPLASPIAEGASA
jgi:hypothetical protein